MKEGGGEKGIFVGDGAEPNYPALLLFLLGGVLGGFATYDSIRHGSNYVAFLTAGLLCSLASLFLVILKGRKKK
jgi:hypothetical protein